MLKPMKFSLELRLTKLLLILQHQKVAQSSSSLQKRETKFRLEPISTCLIQMERLLQEVPLKQPQRPLNQWLLLQPQPPQQLLNHLENTMNEYR